MFQMATDLGMMEKEHAVSQYTITIIIKIIFSHEYSLLRTPLVQENVCLLEGSVLIS